MSRRYNHEPFTEIVIMENRLTAFLYVLMNNHVPVSTIDKIMEEVSEMELDSFGDFDMQDPDLENIARAKAILIMQG